MVATVAPKENSSIGQWSCFERGGCWATKLGVQGAHYSFPASHFEGHEGLYKFTSVDKKRGIVCEGIALGMSSSWNKRPLGSEVTVHPKQSQGMLVMGTPPTLRLLHPLRGLLNARHSQNMFLKINYHDTRWISCGNVRGKKSLSEQWFHFSKHLIL
jgi:hypothetical protein